MSRLAVYFLGERLQVQYKYEFNAWAWDNSTLYLFMAGLIIALLASIIPAWTASKQDIHNILKSNLIKTAIILGSSRSDGDTFKLVSHFRSQLTGCDYYDLNDYDISYYDYAYRNSEDDFLPLVKKLVDHYDLFIFASPVYWYAMSAQLKTFFDRLSDLIRVEKETGRKLRGKSMAVISCASEKELIDGFIQPFQHSADYLSMNFLGNVHGYVGEGALDDVVKSRINAFARHIGS